MRGPRRAALFWGTSLAVAGAFSAAAAWLLPYEWLGLASAAEKRRAWLVTLWSGGVFGLLLGVSALLGVFTGLGLRDLLRFETLKSVREASDERARLWRDSLAAGFHGNFGWWTVATGGLLILAYFAAWALTD